MATARRLLPLTFSSMAWFRRRMSAVRHSPAGFTRNRFRTPNSSPFRRESPCTARKYRLIQKIENDSLKAVLQIWYVYPGSEYFPPRIPDPNFSQPWSRIRIFLIPDSGSASKNLSILTPKMVSKLQEIWFRLFIPDPDPDFLPIPDPGVKKAPDPGSGSATLIKSANFVKQVCWILYRVPSGFAVHTGGGQLLFVHLRDLVAIHYLFLFR